MPLSDERGDEVKLPTLPGWGINRILVKGNPFGIYGTGESIYSQKLTHTYKPGWCTV